MLFGEGMCPPAFWSPKMHCRNLIKMQFRSNSTHNTFLTEQNQRIDQIRFIGILNTAFIYQLNLVELIMSVSMGKRIEFDFLKTFPIKYEGKFLMKVKYEVLT